MTTKRKTFIWFTVRDFHECLYLSVCVCVSSRFGFEDGMWDLIVLVHGHFLFFTL